MKKRIIIIVIVVLCVFVVSFFIIRFNVVGRIYNLILNNINEESSGELKYETWKDKDGNEYEVEFRKISVKDSLTGEVVEMFVETKDPKIIYLFFYKGEIEKIEGSRIYFMVDKEGKSSNWFSFKDVDDHLIVFDIDNYDLESNPYSMERYWPDYITIKSNDPLEPSEFIHSAEELEFLVGDYVMVQDTKFSDYYTNEEYKELTFYLE